MTNRNNNIWSKKSFFSHVILFLLISVGTVHTGLTELYHIKTSDGKSIILAGDNHSLYNFSEIMEMVELIVEQEEKNKSITLLIEQALNTENTFSTSSRMLISLPKLLADESLNKTTIKNIEIRTMDVTICDLLNDKNDLNWLSNESFFQNGSSAPKIMVKDIVFRQLYDEYNCLKKIISVQYQKYDDVHIQELFEQQIDTAEQRYQDLLYIFDKWKNKYGIQEDETIIHLIEKLKHAELKLTQKKGENKERLRLNEKLTVYIGRVFIPLFNINAFDHILQQKASSDIVLMVAGASHARVMKNWLASWDETIINKENINSPISSDIVNHLAAILNTENSMVDSI